MILKFLIYLVTIGRIRVRADGCPDKWREHNDHCYLLGNLLGEETKPRTWHQAKAACELYGAHLVVIDDEEENNFISYGLAPKTRPWIGLFDKNEKSQWTWVDGTDLSYSKWDSGQPDHWEAAPGISEACVEMYQESDGKWNDAGCHILKEYICELDYVGRLSQCDIQRGWKEHVINGATSCYLYDELTDSPWYEAEQDCESKGGNLAVISSEAENDLIYALMGADRFQWWIGLSNVGHLDNQMTWVTSESSYKDRKSYKNFIKGKSPPPNGKPGNLTCVEQLAKSNTDISGNQKEGLWATSTHCGEQKDYICEAKPMGSCPLGWQLYNGNCYMINTARLTTWTVAKDSCEAVGASLLKISSDEEQGFLKSTLYQTASDLGDDKSIWIGFSDSSQNPDGAFRWTDGTAVDDGHSFTNWADLQPENRPGWDCGSIYIGNPNLNWETHSCFQEQGFICKIKSGLELKNPAHTQYKGCKPGWVAFKDPSTNDIHCYLLDQVGEFSWDDGEAQCKTFGNDIHLASVHSGEEQSFIQSAVHDNLWIGGSRMSSSSGFSWTDQSKFDFYAWVNGFPSASETGQRCIQMLVSEESSGWVDESCTSSAGIICKDIQANCFGPMGVEDGSIKDSQMHGSTYIDGYHHGRAARLNSEKSWTPDPLRDLEGNRPYLKIELVSASSDRSAGFQVHGIATQGDEEFKTWVTKFSVDYTAKARPSDDDWKMIQDFDGNDAIFDGNSNAEDIHTNVFLSPVTARQIRIWPIENGFETEDYKLYKSMRVEIYGCNKDGSEINDGDQDETCNVMLSERLECGFEGITAGECRSRGCCYDTSLATPHCFYHKGDHDRHCSPGWHYAALGITPHCYYLSASIQRNYQGNIAFCSAERAQPLRIDGPSEQDWLTETARNLIGTDKLWTGGNKADPNTGWNWFEWPSFPYVNWDSSQPNKENDFITMNTANGKWQTHEENENWGVACKRHASGQGETPDGDAFHEQICENEIQVLTCGPIQSFMINIKSALYGRTSKTPCGDVNSNCKKTLDVTEFAKKECNNRHHCQLQPTNSWGDPCPNVYKYLDVYFECVESTCFTPLLDSSGKKGKELSASTGQGKDAFYSNSGWISKPDDTDIWLQYTNDDKSYKLWGLSTWGVGAGDETGLWVTEYYLEFQSKYDENRWYPYKEGKSNDVYYFSGNIDPFSEKHHNLKDSFTFNVLRIRPKHWHTFDGDDIGSVGMRVEFYGCVADDILSCVETSEKFISESSPDGTSVTKHCVPNCREANIGYKLFGDGVYSGDSQVCMAAIHAGVIEDGFGGDVAIVKQAGQEKYKSAYKNGVGSQTKDDGFEFSYAFSNPLFNCPKGSKEFGDFCFTFHASPLSWQEAENECVKQGAHLASIHHKNEQAFIESLLVQSSQDDDHMWIGLKDFGSNGYFLWTDDTAVQFTNWNPGEPNHRMGDDQTCVEMYRNGLWNDHNCGQTAAFVCKFGRGHYPVTDEGPDEGCQKGWQGFEDHCYLFVTDEYHSQEGAKKACIDYPNNGVLAKIPDQETNAFIHSTLSQLGFWEFWHGLEQPPGDNQVQWFWQDGTVPAYTAWAPELPNPQYGQCSYFLGSTISNGKWYQDKCQGKYKYYICQKERDGYPPKPPPTKPPHPDGCPGSESDGWVINSEDPKSDYCYKFYTNDQTKEVNWKSAQHQCKGQKAELLSIANKEESDAMLKMIQTLLPDEESVEFWIGLDSTRDGWIWTDGTPMTYLHWSFGFPSLLDGHNAGVMYYQTGRNGTSNSWQNVLPTQNRQWICKILKGTELPKDPSPPKVDPDTSCSSGGVPEFDSEFGNWYSSGTQDSCFFVSKDKKSYFGAKEKCEKISGYSLISVHSQTEMDLIQGGAIDLGSTTENYFLGLREDNSGIYHWSDGSVVDYTQWDEGQPNDQQGSQQCIKFYKRTGYWSDVNCAHEYGYICARMKATPPPVEPEKPHCAKGWLEYQDNCYQFGEKGTRISWDEAGEKCKSAGGNLASFPTAYSNAFIFAQSLSYAESGLWIGLHDQEVEHSYGWVDNSPVTFTNWASGEPNHGGASGNSENCVIMLPQNGLWNDVNCEDHREYVCSKPKTEDKPNSGDNQGCPDGFTPFLHSDGSIHCWLFDSKEKTYQQAKADCIGRANDAELGSILEAPEQEYAYALAHGADAWIGLEWNIADAQYQWSDNWPVWYTKWGEGFPDSNNPKRCVAITENKNKQSEWIQSDCNEVKASICMVRSHKAPQRPIDIEGTCPYDSGNVQKYSTKCVWPVEEYKTWHDADIDCGRKASHLGGHIKGYLMSIHSVHDIEFVQNMISSSIWIGLTTNRADGWMWSDGTAVQFTQWTKGEPSSDEENCVEMYQNGFWNDAKCSMTKAYVCEAPIIAGYDDNGIAIPAKPIYPDGPAGGPTQAPPSDGLAGEVIGIIVGVCVGVVFIMYGVFAVGKRQGLELGIAAGTVNALGSTIDNAGNSIINVGSELKRGVMNVIYDSDDDDNDEEVGIGNPNSRL